MIKKQSHRNRSRGKQKPDSVFREAWTNMNDDMSRILPDSLAKRLRSGKGKAWIMIVTAFVELVLLGVVGKVLYDWFIN
jgi:hypothetical protein